MGYSDLYRLIGDNDRRIASEDVEVIKIVRGDSKNTFKSAYYNFKYKLNGNYECEMPHNLFNIEIGFHSYIPSRVFISSNKLGIEVRTYSSLILDWFGDEKNRKFKNVLYIMHCIIPKGSAYYVNSLGEAVSEKIRVVGFEKASEYNNIGNN